MEPEEPCKVSRNGKVLGTYSENGILSGLASGELLQTDHYWRQGMGQWSCLSEFKPRMSPPQPDGDGSRAGIAVGAVLIVVLILCLAIGSASQDPPTQASGAASEHAPSRQQARLTALNSELSAAEGRVAALLTKFTAQEDKFQKLTWYTHKNEGPLTSKLFKGDKNCLLLVRVNSLGGRYLISAYSGKTWIFHTKVEFRIGEDVYKTGEIPLRDNDRTATGTKVLETCNYMSDENRKLCSVLARAAETGAQIHYRLSGDHDNLERLAPDEEAEAIRDSVALADALAERERIKRELASAEAGR